MVHIFFCTKEFFFHLFRHWSWVKRKYEKHHIRRKREKIIQRVQTKWHVCRVKLAFVVREDFFWHKSGAKHHALKESEKKRREVWCSGWKSFEVFIAAFPLFFTLAHSKFFKLFAVAGSMGKILKEKMFPGVKVILLIWLWYPAFFPHCSSFYNTWKTGHCRYKRFPFLFYSNRLFFSWRNFSFRS